MSKEAHIRRVTLNLARYTAGTPPELVAAVNRLAEAGWNYSALSNAELEAVYAFCDHDLTSDIVRQWNVDTRTIRDWGHPFDDMGRIAEWCQPSDARETDCKLCGHKHNRWEFLATNQSNGNTLWLGSTCVSEYKFAVDGERTAEGALARLRGALSQAKDRQTAAEWAAVHPDWHDVAEELLHGVESLEWLAKSGDYAAASRVGVRLVHFRWERPKFVKRYERVMQQIAKKGCLTDITTAEAYGTLRSQARQYKQVAFAIREDLDLTNREWDEFVSRHATVLTSSDHVWIARKRDYGDRLSSTNPIDAARVQEIVRRSLDATPTSTPTPRPAGAASYTESDAEYAARRAAKNPIPTDTFDDLPWNR